MTDNILNSILNILNKPITTNYYLAALIGVLATFPSMAASAISVSQRPSLDLYKFVDLENKLWKMPLFYMFLNMFGFYIVNTFLPPSLRKYWVVGILLGLVYPTLGTIGDYAKKAYGITSYYDLYFKAQILYVAFYGLVISFMVHFITKCF